MYGSRKNYHTTGHATNQQEHNNEDGGVKKSKLVMISTPTPTSISQCASVRMYNNENKGRHPPTVSLILIPELHNFYYIDLHPQIL
jgi:hypothetical protein